MTRRLAAGLIAGITFLVSASSAESPTPAKPVGAATRKFVPKEPYNWREAGTQALLTTIWYPANPGTPASEHNIGEPAAPLFRLGRWADDAPPAQGRFPLIVLSHGTGGTAQMMAWLGQRLASRGYIAAAVNHPGNNALERYTPEGFLLWWERARDLTTVIDMLLDDDKFGPLIDPRRIGAAGFSLGGYTTAVIAGARTDPDLFRKFCQAPQAEGCADPPEFPGILGHWANLTATSETFRQAVGEARRSRRDARVRAVFAIAPALGPALIPESLRKISIPMAIVAGSDDNLVPVRSNAQSLAKLVPKAKLTLLPDVGHYTFLATCTDGGRKAHPALCTDAASVDREAVHGRTAESAAHFFDRALK